GQTLVKGLGRVADRAAEARVVCRRRDQFFGVRRPDVGRARRVAAEQTEQRRRDDPLAAHGTFPPRAENEGIDRRLIASARRWSRSFGGRVWLLASSANRRRESPGSPAAVWGKPRRLTGKSPATHGEKPGDSRGKTRRL